MRVGFVKSPIRLAPRDDLARPIRLLVRLLRQDVAGIRGCLEEKEALDELVEARYRRYRALYPAIKGVS